MSGAPHWKGRGIAAAAIVRKNAERAKPTPRDYIGPALAALPTSGTITTSNNELFAAIIIAQALDRLGDRLSEVAAISNYKRT